MKPERSLRSRFCRAALATALAVPLIGLQARPAQAADCNCVYSFDAPGEANAFCKGLGLLALVFTFGTLEVCIPCLYCDNSKKCSKAAPGVYGACLQGINPEWVKHWAIIAHAIDWRIEAFLEAGRAGGGPPDARMWERANLLPLDPNQQLFSMVAASGIVSTVWGDAFFGGFYKSSGCDIASNDPAACYTANLGFGEVVGPVPEEFQEVLRIVKHAMLLRLTSWKSQVDHYRRVMSQIDEFPDYQRDLKGACQFPHPPGHGHPFPFRDAGDCVTEEVAASSRIIDEIRAGRVPPPDER